MVSQRVWGRETNTVCLCLCSLWSLGWAWQLWGRQKFCGLPRVLFVCFFFFFVCFVFTLLLLPLLLLLLFLLWFMRWKCVNFLALIFTFVVGFMPVHFSLLRYLGAAFFGSAARTLRIRRIWQVLPHYMATTRSCVYFQLIYCTMLTPTFTPTFEYSSSA